MNARPLNANCGTPSESQSWYAAKIFLTSICAAGWLTLSAVAIAAATNDSTNYDIVILGGRVMDPASGFDAVANVGIVGDRIAAVTKDEISGRRKIDARGQVVAPGFIDILSAEAGFDLEGNRYKVTDGVTSILWMHGGPADVGKWYETRARQGALVNYGVTVGHVTLREAVGVSDRNAAASPTQLQQMLAMARKSIYDGAVGIGFGVEYVPGASADEIIGLFQLAADMGVPCHLHIRFLGAVPPSNSIKGIQEVIAAAAATGARAQIAHINSSTGREIATALRLIEGARAHGVDIMADAYPWTAGSTRLESAVFDPGWQLRMSASYEDIELVKTGERLTETSFRKYREDGELTPVIAHFIPQQTNDLAFRSPLVMLSSDGGIHDGKGHPRGAGTYAKFLREYVRERQQISLMEALRKMSTLPAQRLAAAAPVMRRKGRLSEGADADIVVFDPQRVRENATYAEPAQYSEGFSFVLVRGVPVVDQGRLSDTANPGRPILGAPHDG